MTSAGPKAPNMEDMRDAQDFDRPVNYYEMPYMNPNFQYKKKQEDDSNYIPVGMSLFIFQNGFNDLVLTMAWRGFWLVALCIIFGVQYVSYEPALLTFRLSFWSLIISIIYFSLGLLQVILKSMDKSLLTRLVQMFYVITYSFTMGTSLFYIFLLFMDDINRNNPRKDHLYIVLSDGYISYPYLKTHEDLKDPSCETEFYHKNNALGIIGHKSKYSFFWFYHVFCHILLPCVLMTSLYIENTRIYYTDLIATMVTTILYTGLLWVGSLTAYNRNENTPCIGTRSPTCQDNKINPEYRTIYTKLNFYQRGETAAYILLLYFFVFVAFYLARQISKRYARSALQHYKNIAKNLPVTEALQTLPQMPDEISSRAEKKDQITTNQVPNNKIKL